MKRTAKPLTPAQLDAASAITPADLAADIPFWKLHGSPLTRALLDAGGPTPKADS